MNDPRAFRRSVALSLLIALTALSACGRQPPEPPPLAGAAIGGPFRLIDQGGHAVTERDFAGRWRIVYFGYTYCPDVCPTTLQTLMHAYRDFAGDHGAAASKLALIFISVDPDRDTPAMMKTYVAAFGPPLIGLTGSDAEIDKVAKEFGVYRHAQKANAAGAYLVDHSSQAILFDPAGKPIALLPTDQGAAATEREIARWVR